MTTPDAPRPKAITLIEAFDSSVTLDDLRELDDDDLLLFIATVTHWDVVAREQHRRRHPR